MGGKRISAAHARLMHEGRTRKVRADGIHFQSLRYLSLTLTAYVGEEVTIRLDPRDMGEIRVSIKASFYAARSRPSWPARPFRCAILSVLANRRRKELRSIRSWHSSAARH
jgi:putative transposase